MLPFISVCSFKFLHANWNGVYSARHVPPCAIGVCIFFSEILWKQKKKKRIGFGKFHWKVAHFILQNWHIFLELIDWKIQYFQSNCLPILNFWFFPSFYFEWYIAIEIPNFQPSHIVESMSELAHLAWVLLFQPVPEKIALSVDGFEANAKR